jgi:hypothetical protein
MATAANVCSSRDARVQAEARSVLADLHIAFQNAVDVGTSATYFPLVAEGKRGIHALNAFE